MNPAMPSLNQQLQDNLQAQQVCAEELLGVLAEEHAALMSSDVSHLERVTRRKGDAAVRLQQLGQGMNRLRGAQSMDDLVARAAGALPNLWQKLRTLALQCQTANQDNAVLLAARDTQLRKTMRALRPSETPELYGRSGRTGLGLGGQRFGAA